MSRHAAYVFDLDGVVRDFASGSADGAIEATLGLPAGAVSATAFRDDLVMPTITGLQSFEHWYGAICAELEKVVADPDEVRAQMRAWHAHRGTPIAETVERLSALRAEGRRTYLFTNGTDHVPTELDLLGISGLFDGVLNSADFGVAKPDPEAYGAAHRAIEQDLEQALAGPEIWFTDDRAENVVAARDFGWHAELFVPAPT
ncbi:MAG: HAD hydrolase-like protein [Humibacillus sp.]|nr:HAD hydrolase-like protein [Humibacillus sp.]